MADRARDIAVRLAAFRFLSEQTRLHGETVQRETLSSGFSHDGQRVPLIAPNGIFTPAVCALPLSITTVPPSPRKQRPYDDELGDDGVIRYRYRGTDRGHRDNRGLRQAMSERIPMIYFHGVVPSVYLPVWPVYVVHDDPAALTFSVQVDDASAHALLGELGDVDTRSSLPESAVRREYVTVLAKRRLHQAEFRARVIKAYHTHCAVCRLRHEELLDAAHITADRDAGEPVVSNGLSLCKLHHAAFDHNVIGIQPDGVIRVSQRVLEEIDGPMLRYGLQEMEGSKILVPRRKDWLPDPARLERRFEEFRLAQ